MIAQTQKIKITDTVSIGGNLPVILVAGPCVIEDENICTEIAEKLVRITEKLSISFIFKASFDKANRSSIDSFRGPGLEKGLEILHAIKEKYGIPVTSDIHLPSQAEKAASVLDMIQIPAFLCRQTDILIAAANTGKPVNVKKGQFLSPEETAHIIQKLKSAGNSNVCITERGTTFGYNRLVNDFTCIPKIRTAGTPLIFDATHSVQFPGAEGDRSGGAREFIPFLARAAAGTGIDGLFLETHPDPDKGKCDRANMMKLDDIEALLTEVLKIDAVVKNELHANT